MARQEQDKAQHGPTEHPAGVVENWLRYNQTPWGRLRLDLVRWQLERWVPARVMPVLDAGCGTGETAIWLASRGGRVVAIDQSEAMLAVARRRAEAAAVKVDWRIGNIPEDIPDDVFELVVCHNLLGYLPEPAAACAEMAERLRPGGYLSSGCVERARPPTPYRRPRRRPAKRRCEQRGANGRRNRRFARTRWRLRPHNRSGDGSPMPGCAWSDKVGFARSTTTSPTPSKPTSTTPISWPWRRPCPKTPPTTKSAP